MRKLLLWIVIITSCTPQNQNEQLTSHEESIFSTTCTKITDLDVLVYTISNKDDTVQYIKIGTDITSVKPTILFLQGSLPIPLIIDFKNFKHINIPFQYSELIKEFHLIEISMPHTPIEVEKNNLNNQYCFVTDTTNQNSFKKEYLKNNYLDNYVSRANIVISDLLSQKWVDKDQIHIIGHSQGAKIAAVVASQNKSISSVSLLGFNAFGRFDENIRRERNNLRQKKITGDEYLNNIENHYKRWEQIHQNPNDYENGNLNWTSFSIDYVPFLLDVNAPIFVGYGTEDISAENGDLLPIIFIENKKQNLTVKPYVGLEHNFFEIKNGNPDYQSGNNWNKVINDVLIWMKNNETFSSQTTKLKTHL
ncbi:MAG: hypothetical protein RQ875_07770 [Vicingaceae bacterium]|nr:hypothetical protein [Vicingaceae bacterium]